MSAPSSSSPTNSNDGNTETSIHINIGSPSLSLPSEKVEKVKKVKDPKPRKTKLPSVDGLPGKAPGKRGPKSGMKFNATTHFPLEANTSEFIALFNPNSPVFHPNLFPLDSGIIMDNQITIEKTTKKEKKTKGPAVIDDTEIKKSSKVNKDGSVTTTVVTKKTITSEAPTKEKKKAPKPKAKTAKA